MTFFLAQISGPAAIDQLQSAFQSQVGQWEPVMTHAATTIFWSLAFVSFVWTFGQLAAKGTDWGELTVELVRYIGFTGFGWFFLINGPRFGHDILQGFMQLGGQSMGLPNGLSPTVVLDLAMGIYQRVTASLNFFLIGPAFIASIGLFLILTCAAVIAVNILNTLAAAWILLYAGIIFLGFGGSRWTHPWSLGYYTSLIGIGARMMTMEVIIGLGVKIVQSLIGNINDTPNGQQVAACFVLLLVLAFVSHSVPSMVASVLSGGNGIHSLGNLAMGVLAYTVLQSAIRTAVQGALRESRSPELPGTNAVRSAIQNGQRARP